MVLAGKRIGLFNNEGLEEQLVCQVALGVGLEEDDGQGRNYLMDFFPKP